MPETTPGRYGLLMDLDGTIANTLPHLFRSFRHAVAPFVGRLPDDAAIVATFGPPERDCLAKLLANGSPAACDGLDEAVRRFHAYYEGRHEEVQTFPGITEAIDTARAQGWRFGVFTGKGRRSASFTLERLGLWDRVECLVSGEEVRCPKPDPEGVRLALDRLGVRPDHLVVVGDTPADVLAGKAAGAWTVAALWGAFDPEALRQAGPSWALTRPDQLPAVLEQVQQRPPVPT